MNATLYRQNVVLSRPLRASAQVHHDRSRLFLRVERDGLVGFGEVAPQPLSINGDPGIDDVIAELFRTFERLDGVLEREGDLPSWSRVARLVSATPASNVAAALIEMALLDREMRADDTVVEELWTPAFNTPTQVGVSLLDEEPWSIGPEVERVRAKTSSGPVSASALERLATLSVPVVIDFNCSATNDEDVLSQLAQISAVATVDAVEQPFDIGNVVDHARLAAKLDVALSLDEGVRSLRDLSQVVRYRAATMICVKPARVGGLANARTLIERAKDQGLRVYLGGFFESPYARRVHRAFANAFVSDASDLGAVALSDDADLEVAVTTTSFGFEPSSALLACVEALPVRERGAS